MIIIGVTGGVGAGKSALLKEVEKRYNCRVIYSDDVANDVKKKGMPAYDKLVDLLGKDILEVSADGTYGEIDKKKMAKAIFNDDILLQKVNAILHPATNDYIDKEVTGEREKGKLDYLFIEAALLIENGYKDKANQLWYVYASEDVRRQRLSQNRGYSDEKITSIFYSQLSEYEFRKNCDFSIDNSTSLEDALSQIDRHLNGEDALSQIDRHLNGEDLLHDSKEVT